MADDLAFLIRVLRQVSEWPQETLAELSGLTVRTLEHGEKSVLSSLDARRALARAQAPRIARTTVARGNSHTTSL
jgi:hypothetical protein